MGTPAEDQAVRQYRFLLRTAPLDALQAAHHEALDRLDEAQRARVLDAVRDGLVAGQRLTAGNTAAIARLVSIGERRDPRAFLDACDPIVLRALADAVNSADAAFGLFAGYAAWDGSDPAGRDPGVDHGGKPGRSLDDDPAAEVKAFANSHALSAGPWAGGSGF
ncbi:hypothetical protein SAMN04489867_2592 [Pedococcus dokdonensis]|uniref:Uncharacterized protein n=1 Tax=Pedococcus dokdonensis TaxID=443156 RepID=A0A1H0T1L5_9MICO|nr:hypothetical protein [Pedococcus dokdonensis]SDP47695.1 hypothetical protein SAMN04489867_2592 [Pedococcus dokdonensis]